MNKNINILVKNMKGGTTKTSTASILASFTPSATLWEFDKVNKSDERIKTNFYTSKQVDFKNSDSDSFIEFEQALTAKANAVNIIDVGAVKLVDFFNAMTESELWEELDLLIVPALDGYDDYQVAVKMLEQLKKDGNLPKKILFAFNRFNAEEYDNDITLQFTSFFNNAKDFKKFGIDLAKAHFSIGESRAVKYARENGISIRELVEMDTKALKEKARNCQNEEEAKELIKLRRVVTKAQAIFSNSIEPMLLKIQSTLQG